MDRETPVESLPASLTARFEPVALLGSGAMGLVFHVRERSSGAALALKVIRPALADAINRDRFRREARVMAALEHRRIVRYAGADLDGPVAFLAMELLDGRTLAARLRDGPLPEEEARQLVGGVLEGLVHLHGKGLLHRDLKPSNVFLDRERGPVLIDFGLSRRAVAATALTAADVVMGSLEYMAPELIEQHRASARSDLFALGALALEALCGTPLHGAGPGQAQTNEILSSLASGTYFLAASRLLRARGRMARVILRALARSPADRFATAAEMATALSGADRDIAQPEDLR